MFSVILFIIISFCHLQAYCISLEDCLRSSQSTAKIIDRNHPLYESRNFQFIIQNPIRPLGYIEVHSEDDVVKTIRCGQKLNLLFSIRAGGHSYAKYSFGTNRSWIIDVSKLNKIKIDIRTRTVTVGSVLQMGEINDVVWKQTGYGIVLGQSDQVGVSGISMGGGFGDLTRKHGYLVDQIVGLNIVLANGDLLQINNERYGDLFWAIKGAGAAGFGVVTQFKLKMVPASRPYVWAILSYSISDLFTVLKGWQEILKNSIANTVQLTFLRDDLELPNCFRLKFVITDQIGNTNEQLHLIKIHLPNVTDDVIKSGTYLEMLASSNMRWSNCSSFVRLKSWFVSRYLSENEMRTFADLVAERVYVRLAIDLCQPNSPFRRTDTAFVHRDCIFLIQVKYNINACDNIEEARKLDNKYYYGIKELTNLLSFMDNGESYQNFEDNDLIDWEKRFYAENYPRLQHIKRRYDPTNFFHFNHSISPA